MYALTLVGCWSVLSCALLLCLARKSVVFLVTLFVMNLHFVHSLLPENEWELIVVNSFERDTHLHHFFLGCQTHQKLGLRSAALAVSSP